MNNTKMNINDPNLHDKAARDLDPNVRQRRASDPSASVWVGASAGTGKTKVLTDRVLRLLLPRSEEISGTSAHKILCLTFTKAAASEMALRINNTLAEWAIMDDADLNKKLEDLIGRAPKDYEIQAARKLFAQVIDTAGGLKIMTLHSFCQSILGRFPLEAGISPNFTILDDAGAHKLMQQAKTSVYKVAQIEKTSALSQALHHIASTISEDQFMGLLKDMAKERTQMIRILGKNWNAEGLHSKLCEFLNISPHINANSIADMFCKDESFDLSGLRSAGATLYESDKSTDQKRGQIILNWLNSDLAKRVSSIKIYYSAFLTQKQTLQKTLITKNAIKADSNAESILQKEALRILDHLDIAKKVQCTACTRDLFLLGSKILDQYQLLKNQQNVLDYDDLITTTFQLLNSETTNGHIKGMAGWVLYKLDQGLDHILIDEAQDTNPEQWGIIKTLCEEFFNHLAEKDDITRTIFTVGDEKQSIYSFQRASPEEFETTRQYFTKKITETGHQWNNEDLNISFRSTRSVLEAVDMVFAQDDLKNDAGFSNSSHISYRRGQAGLVELWPLFENEEQQEIDPWKPPINIINTKSGASLCADKIAETIKNWNENGEILKSHDRPIQYGDIMILVRTRTAFVNQLVRALKTLKIPVSGHDRMILNEQLAVQDLMALAEFSLLPNDDLTLACLLKSPFIGFDEDMLFDLAINRKASLWDALKNSDHSTIVAYLQNFIDIATKLQPYEFFTRALATPCPADERSGLRALKTRLGQDALDPIDELLNAALRFEDDHAPSLQTYLHWQKSGQAEIKRELEESGGQVRIMTVHGSKGLQAPIVIIPDTTRTTKNVPNQSDKRLLWPHKTGLNIPLWSPRKDMDFEEFEQAFKNIEQKTDEEYRRLLYVAMTRTEDRLYVAGYTNKKAPIEDCWYNYIHRALKKDTRSVQNDDGVITFSNNQEDEPDRTPKNSNQTKITHTVPNWLFEKAPSEPSPPQPLIPSRPSEMEPSALSPLKSQNQKRFKRGNITHKLLQFLPDIPRDQRHDTALKFVSHYASDLSDAIQHNIIEECIKIMNDETFRPLFGSGSRAEVPITGLINGHELISGQIDRLYIDEHNIWIIDFKTNRPPPRDPKNIPQIYQNQMQAYFDTLKKIYPNHTIHCGLIWTDGPFLMPVDCN